MNACAIRVVAHRRSNRWTFCVAAAALAAASGAAWADPIDDKSYFDGLSPTLIDFETDGSGGSVSLLEGQSAMMPATAYSALGVTFGGGVRWVNDGTPAFDAAQMLGGTPPIAIPGVGVNSFEILFSVPVHAVGMFVVNNRLASGDALPTFTAFGEQGQELGSVRFEEAFVDGSVVFPQAPTIIADYGFMGLSSATPITRLVVEKEAAILDDLTFTAVPAPGAAALGLAAMGLAGVRRRR